MGEMRFLDGAAHLPGMTNHKITTQSGRTADVPEHLVGSVVGLDEEGRLVVDQFGALDAPTEGGFLFGLTLCCNASDKGVEDGVVCRGCFDDADTGNYLFAVLSGAGEFSFPGFDPIATP